MPGVRRLLDMNEHLGDLISALDSIRSVDDEAELERLDSAVSQVLASDRPELGTDALLRIFERFPEKDGYGVFWSILHGLEKIPGYEAALVESVRRRPSLFGLDMINRILNVGRRQVNGVDLLALLEEVAGSPEPSGVVKENAKDLVEWQRGRA